MSEQRSTDPKVYLRLRKEYGDSLPWALLSGYGDYAKQTFMLEYWDGSAWTPVPMVESDDWDSPIPEETP